MSAPDQVPSGLEGDAADAAVAEMRAAIDRVFGDGEVGKRLRALLLADPMRMCRLFWRVRGETPGGKP